MPGVNYIDWHFGREAQHQYKLASGYKYMEIIKTRNGNRMVNRTNF